MHAEKDAMTLTIRHIYYMGCYIHLVLHTHTRLLRPVGHCLEGSMS
jgi:hypothetical protein